MIIDFHTHAFPEKVAARAINGLALASGGFVPQTDGTVSSLLEQMDLDGVDISVVQSIATNPTQQTNVNNYAISINQHERIIAFGSVHPDSPDALEELERIAAAGLKGVKLHPQYQLFYPDEERMKPIYRKISELGLITLYHAGQDTAFAPPYRSMPEHLLRALKWFDTPVVAAHWGGLVCNLGDVNRICGENIWFDISMGYGILPRPVAMEIINKQGADKLLFGSDMPWHRPEWELRLLNTLDISEYDREKILFRNAQKLLNL